MSDARFLGPGIALGVLFGYAFDKPGVGLTLGIAAGLVLARLLRPRR